MYIQIFKVSKASVLGEKQMASFQDELSDAFGKTLSTKDSLMQSAKDKRFKRKSDKDECNTDVIFSRVFLLLRTKQIKFDKIFDYELASVLLSLFNESGAARYPKSKSVQDRRNRGRERARAPQ